MSATGYSRAEIDVLDAIRSYRSENGFAPTVRDLAELLGCGHSTIQRAIVDLEARGRISKTAGVARSIVVNKRGGTK
jgi:DNA-binding transcriptional regulator YhcF (GntR family)